MRLLYLISFLLCTMSCNAQTKYCTTIKDTFLLIRISIAEIDRHPIIMLGVSKESLDNKICKMNGESCIYDFYKYAYYIPTIPEGMFKMANSCLGDTIGKSYFDKAQKISSQFFDELGNTKIKRRYNLESGGSLNISEIWVSGTFWKVQKTHAGLIQSSNELPIIGIPGIDTCLVPFKIFRYPSDVKSN